MRIIFTRQEIKEIIIATLVLSVAFAIAFSGGFRMDINNLPSAFIFSFIGVGVGFIAHELIGHKLFAQHFEYHAEFRMWKYGLFLAVIFSFAGFVFAAPGAVMIGSRMDLWGNEKPITRKKYGIISLAGPLVNVGLALIFLAVNIISQSRLWELAVSVNVWLALFNMLPIPPLDGSKVFAWDRRVFAVVFAALIGMFVLL